MTQRGFYDNESEIESERVRQSESQPVRQSGSSSTTTTTTIAHATGRAHVCMATKKSIAETWMNIIGPWDLTAASICARYAEVMDLDCIQHAIEATAEAPRPSKQYLKAILRRYSMAGIRTYEDVLRDEDVHEQEMQYRKHLRESRWFDDLDILTDKEHERYLNECREREDEVKHDCKLFEENREEWYRKFDRKRK